MFPSDVSARDALSTAASKTFSESSKNSPKPAHLLCRQSFAKSSVGRGAEITDSHLTLGCQRVTSATLSEHVERGICGFVRHLSCQFPGQCLKTIPSSALLHGDGFLSAWNLFIVAGVAGCAPV